MKTKLASSLLFLATSSAIASAEPIDDCRMKLMNVTNNLPSSPRSSSEAEARLKTARGFWQQGAACAPKFAQLKPLFDSTKAALDKSEQQKAVLVQMESFEAQIASLQQRITSADAKSLDKLVGEAGALATKIQEFGRKNGYETPLASELRNLERTSKTRADQLAKANVAAANQAIVDAAITRLGFQPDDAFDQAKIRDAFAKAEASDLVVILPEAKGIEFRPVVVDHLHLRHLSATKPLPYRADVVRFEGKMQLLYEVDPPGPAGQTPALVWNAVGRDTVAIVTIDGGRYHAHVGSLAKQISKPETWPTKVTNHALHPDDIARLVESKLLPAPLLATMTKENDANEKCNKKFWDKAKPQNDAIARANISEGTREQRYRLLQDKLNKQADAACGKHEVAYRKAWTKAVETRRADRDKTLQAATARLKALAPN